MLKYESQICHKDKAKQWCIEIYVEALNRGKTMGTNLHYMYSGYTIPRRIQHSYECINHAGLFASAAPHTAMVRLTVLSLLHSTTHMRLYTTLCSTLTSVVLNLRFALVAYILIQLSGYLHIWPSWGTHLDYLQV